MAVPKNVAVDNVAVDDVAMDDMAVNGVAMGDVAGTSAAFFAVASVDWPIALASAFESKLARERSE